MTRQITTIIFSCSVLVACSQGPVESVSTANAQGADPLAGFPEFGEEFAADFAVQRGADERITVHNSILVYVDYVSGLDNLMNTMPADVYKNNIEAFAKMNPLFKMPTVRLGGIEPHPYYGSPLKEITDHVTHDVRHFDRKTASGFTAEFAEWLESTGRKNVIIGGISIDSCLMYTSLDLLAAGYNVYVVADVSSTNSKYVEDIALNRLDNEGAIISTWFYVLRELGRSWEGPYGDGMWEIVSQHWANSTMGPTEDTTPDGTGFRQFKDEPEQLSQSQGGAE